MVIRVPLRCNNELSAQPVCLYIGAWGLRLLGWSLTAMSDRWDTHQCPKEGCWFLLPILGTSSLPIWCPKSHWCQYEKGDRKGWERASSGPFWGFSHPCPFRTHLCSHFGLLMSTELTLMPGNCLLCEPSGCCWHWWWVQKELGLTLGDPVPGICGLGASCLWGWNSSTLKRINKRR